MYVASLPSRLSGIPIPTIVVMMLIAKATKLRRIPSGKCFVRALLTGMTLAGGRWTLKATESDTGRKSSLEGTQGSVMLCY